jgi:hypothetical protein
MLMMVVHQKKNCTSWLMGRFLEAAFGVGPRD